LFGGGGGGGCSLNGWEMGGWVCHVCCCCVLFLFFGFGFQLSFVTIKNCQSSPDSGAGHGMMDIDSTKCN